MVRKLGLVAGRSGLLTGAVADGIRGLEPPVAEKVGAEVALSGRQRPGLWRRGRARVDEKAAPGSKGRPRGGYRPAASVAGNLCGGRECPGFWSRREPPAE